MRHPHRSATPRDHITISGGIVRQGRLELAGRLHGGQLRKAAALLHGRRQALRPARELALAVGTNGSFLGRAAGALWQ